MMLPLLAAVGLGMHGYMLWKKEQPVLDPQGYPYGCESFRGLGIERCEHVYCQLLRNARRGKRKR